MRSITAEHCLLAAACAGNIDACKFAIEQGARDIDCLMHIANLRNDQAMRELAISYGARDTFIMPASAPIARELSDAQWMLQTAECFGHAEVAEYARFLIES